MSVILIILYVLSTSGGLILLKLGTASGLPISFMDGALKFSFNPLAFAGIFLYGLSFLLYIYLISKFQLGYIVPLTTALVYTLVFLASYFVFHEVFTALKIIAIALIISGVIILSLNK